MPGLKGQFLPFLLASLQFYASDLLQQALAVGLAVQNHTPRGNGGYSVSESSQEALSKRFREKREDSFSKNPFSIWVYPHLGLLPGRFLFSLALSINPRSNVDICSASCL